MSKWMEGYASSNVYTKGFYRDLNPNLAVFSLLCAGIRPPVIKNACELGFGYGMNLNFYASTQKTNWYGNDFDPTQKNYANNLCDLSDNGAVLSDASFAQLAEDCNWPKFDFISLHGIWSWISETNQENILKFICDHLSDDGVVYISYNSSPGCQIFQPVRELMKDKFENGTKKNDSLESRIAETLAYVKDLGESGGHFLENNSQVTKRIQELSNHTPAYILHEYLNDSWHIENFYSIKQKLERIKLKYVCSSNLQNTVSSLNYTEKQKSFLSNLVNSAEREYVSDLFWSETFRKDYWAKGPNVISNQERLLALENFRVIQCKPREDIAKEFIGRHSSGSIENELYNAVIELIEKSETASLKELSDVIDGNSIDAAIEITRVLISLGFIQLTISDEFIGLKNNLSSVAELNNVLCRESVKNENSINYLCSPKTGESLYLSRFTLIYIHARNNGSEDFDSACLTVVHECQKNNEIFHTEGVDLTDEKDAHSFVMREVGAIIDKFGPVYAKHGLILSR